MHDDSNIHTLRTADALHLVATEKDGAKGDVQRRAARRDFDGANLELVAQEVNAYQKDDLDPTVREMPMDAEVFAWRNQVALLRQEHKDLDKSVRALELVPLPDQILIARLKRKKLAIRDRIATIEDKIRPDIIA